MQNLNYKTKIEILSTIDELKQIVRSNGFQESPGSNVVVIDVETVIDLLDDLIQFEHS